IRALQDSVEPATESIGEFDQDTVGISDICRPAAGPLDDLDGFGPKSEPAKATDGLVDVIDHESDMIDVNAFRLEISAADFTKTDVETVAGTEDAPPAVVTLLLELESEQTGIEPGRHVKVADGNIYMIHAPRVHWRGWTQSGTRFADLDVYGS